MPQVRRITLIEPEPPGFHVFSYFKMPRLGLPLLGAILRREGYEVHLHLGCINRKAFDTAIDSDLIGISTITSTAPEAYRLADLFRQAGKTVVIGGVHATFMRDEAMQHADYVVCGEAEESLPELVKAIRSDEPPVDIPGVSYRDQGEIVHNPQPSFISDLDKLPFPDFSLFGPDLKLCNTPIQTSRGCPFPCNFCTVTKMFGRKVRFRSVEHVLAELEQIPKTEVFFCDDNFCGKPAYTRELLEGMLRRGVNLKYWSAQVRAEVTRDPDLMDLLARSGCDLVYVGFESINPASLKEYDKRQTVEDIAAAMEVFRRFKIRVHGMFVIGSDHDSIETARQTLRFALDQGIDTVQFMMLTPIPGTTLYEELNREGRIISRDWSLYDAHHAVFLPRLMSPQELQKTTIAAMNRFYSLSEAWRGLTKRDLFMVTRRLMGWYLIRRWKWDNRKWMPQLRAESLKTHRALLDQRLKDIRRQLDDVLVQIRDSLPQLEVKLDEIRKKGEVHLKEISRISRELVSAWEPDLEPLERRIEEISDAVRDIFEEIQGLAGMPGLETAQS